MHRIPLLLAYVCIIVAQPLRAQAVADSTAATFHRGEWGVGFGGRYLAEAGVLGFVTPTLAMVLDGWAGLDRQVVSTAGTSGADQSRQSINLSATLGPRWHHAVSAHVVRFFGLGVSGSYGSASYAGSSNSDKNWSAGAYGEVGLQYMFTPHLGLGWRGNLQASRIEEHQTFFSGTPTKQQTTYCRLTVEPVQVIGTLYF